MTPTQHILSTVVLLTLSACGESNPESNDPSPPTETVTLVGVDSMEVDPATTEPAVKTDCRHGGHFY